MRVFCSSRRLMWRCLPVAGVLVGLTLLSAMAAPLQAGEPKPRRDPDAGPREPASPPDVEARPREPGPPRGPGGPGFGPERRMPRGPTEPGRMPRGPIAMPGFAGMGGVALAAHGDYVYVLRGNTLYQFAAEGLELIKKVTLEDDRPMGPGRGPDIGPGRGPDIGPGRGPDIGPGRGPEAEPGRPDRPRRREAEPREGKRPERE